MPRQKKVIDINEGGRHLICIHKPDDNYNPYYIYAVISPSGTPLRKRILIKYGDFMSVLYFFRDFYLYGLDTMSVSEVRDWLNEHTA